MKKTTNCLTCGSNNISLDIKLGQLKCNHCNSLVSENKYKKEIQNITQLTENKISKGAINLFKNNPKIIIKCESCETIMHSHYNDSYTRCRICGSSKLKTLDKMPNNKIEYILPFSSTKEDVMPMLKHYIEYRSKKYSKEFIKEFKKENIIPVYIPYQISDINFDCNIEATGIETLKVRQGNDSEIITVQSSDVKRSINVNSKGIYVPNEIDTVNYLEELKEAIISEDTFDTSERINFTEEALGDCYVLSLSEMKKNKITTELLETLAHLSLKEDLMRYDREIYWNNTEIKVKSVTNSYIYLPVWLYFERKIKFGKVVYEYVAINGRKLTTPKYNKIIHKMTIIDCFISVIILFHLFGYLFKDTLQAIGVIPIAIGLLILASIVSNFYYKVNSKSLKAQVLHKERYRNFKSDIKVLKSEDKTVEIYDVKALSGFLNDMRVGL